MQNFMQNATNAGHFAQNDGQTHRRNKEGGQGGPPIRSKIGKIRSKMGAKSCKIGPFWGVVIHENTCCETKFKS